MSIRKSDSKYVVESWKLNLVPADGFYSSNCNEVSKIRD